MTTINPHTLNGIDLEYHPQKDINTYEQRITTRVFVFDTDKNIGLIKHDDMFFPPGGGVEEGETVFEASIREVAEELGVVCNPVDDLGILEQYHEKWMKKFMIHHVYATTQKEEIKVTHEDYDTNLEKMWMNVDEYQILLEKYLTEKPDDIWAKGILYFLKKL